MASTEHTPPTCPKCQQSDQVKTTKAAYRSGIALAAPPALPTRQVTITPYISACILLIGFFLFLIIASLGGMNNLPVTFMWPLFILALLCIISVLVVSYISFQRVVHGDNEAALQYPTYDKAIDTWSHLYYCTRDNIIFDPAA
jgi:hypothetical protein